MAGDFTLFYVGILVPTGITVLVFIAFLVCWFKCGLRYKRSSRPSTANSSNEVLETRRDLSIVGPSASGDAKMSSNKSKKNVYVMNKYNTDKDEGSEHSQDSAIDITELELTTNIHDHENDDDKARLHHTSNRSSYQRSSQSPREIIMNVSSLPRSVNYYPGGTCQYHNNHQEQPSPSRPRFNHYEQGQGRNPSRTSSHRSSDSHTQLIHRGNYPQSEEIVRNCHPKSSSKLYETTADIALYMDSYGIEHNYHEQAREDGGAGGSSSGGMGNYEDIPCSAANTIPRQSAPQPNNNVFSSNHHTNFAFYSDQGPNTMFPPPLQFQGSPSHESPLAAGINDTGLYGELRSSSRSGRSGLQSTLPTNNNTHFNQIHWPGNIHESANLSTTENFNMSTSHV